VLAVAPVALAFLAATFVGAMFARSFKELTFVTVSVSVFLTTFAFVPAVFTEVTPVSRISPLTMVVLDLRGAAVGLREFLFATGPVALAAGLLFALGIGVYREEEMFSRKPVTAKFLGALAVRLSGRRSVAAVAALSIPFVFVAELLAVAVLFALPIGLSLPALLVAIALVEEVAKSVAVYAGYAADLFDRSARAAAGLGIAAGVGFFLGEKATVVVQAVGLPELTLGRAAFAPAGVAGPSALGLLLAPLALHAVTSAVAALGARVGRSRCLVGLGLATLLHAGYNLGVLRLYV